MSAFQLLRALSMVVGVGAALLDPCHMQQSFIFVYFEISVCNNENF